MSHIGKRFRILDVHTPWFWFVSFYTDNESCRKIEATLYGVMVPRWWVYALRWENKPDMLPMFAKESPSVGELSTAKQKNLHKWVGQMRGGSPIDAGSCEWVRYCEVCGMEDECEEWPIPECPGAEPQPKIGDAQ